MARDGILLPVPLGSQVDEQVCRFAGATYWSTGGMKGVGLCQRLVSNPKRSIKRGIEAGPGPTRCPAPASVVP